MEYFLCEFIKDLLKFFLQNKSSFFQKITKKYLQVLIEDLLSNTTTTNIYIYPLKTSDVFYKGL